MSQEYQHEATLRCRDVKEFHRELERSFIDPGDPSYCVKVLNRNVAILKGLIVKNDKLLKKGVQDAKIEAEAPTDGAVQSPAVVLRSKGLADTNVVNGDPTNAVYPDKDGDKCVLFPVGDLLKVFEAIGKASASSLID